MTPAAHPADMTEADLLLRAVLLRPWLDEPRLVYADWLQENGRADRAEFIRVQCRMAELRRKHDHAAPLPDGHPAHAEYAALAARESELFDDEGRTLAWFGLPAPWARVARLEPFTRDDSDYPYAIVRRGFVDEVRCVLSRFAGGPCTWCRGAGSASPSLLCIHCAGTGRHEAARGVFAAQPVQSVTLTDREAAIYWRVPGDSFSFGYEPASDEELAVGRRPSALPLAVWESDHLSERTGSVARRRRHFGDRFAAAEAASAAAIDYGRDLAGLPPLTPEDAR